jgi:hypothetical protein
MYRYILQQVHLPAKGIEAVTARPATSSAAAQGLAQTATVAEAPPCSW